jgi:predicted TIM-barrel fold metal-dependent hydrolase
MNACASAVAEQAAGQPGIDPSLHDLRLREYVPRAAVRRPLTDVPRAAVSAVDAHNHLGRWLTEGWASIDVDVLLDVMNACNVDTIVNLDGMWGPELEANLDRYDRSHPGRFATFAQWDRSMFAEDEWARLGESVQDSARRGARGLKVWKDLGLHLRDRRGNLVFPDDERLDPVWDACAAATIPVTIHVADPVAFFEPLDRHNERLEELLAHPEWWFGDRARFPTLDRILESLESLIARRPDVTFIGAHALCCAEDLAWVDRMLSMYPNANADIGARIPELGRMPLAARDVIVRHADRFLFGTDAFPPDARVYATHFRFLQTADEHFPYDPWDDEPPSQGRWAISGLDLPADVLAAVLRDNARRLIRLG